MRHATYELEEIGTPTLAEVLAPIVDLVARPAEQPVRTSAAGVDAEQVAQVADDHVGIPQ